MNEKEYIITGNLARLQIISETLRWMHGTKECPTESIRSFQQWAARMIDRHHAAIDLFMHKEPK